ncbi:MAG: hypothetical protein JKY37_00560 [Nannocystaceae bacterium]|nr:hypothetical protein [Nannocystaceae bacterium]
MIRTTELKLASVALFFVAGCPADDSGGSGESDSTGTSTGATTAVMETSTTVVTPDDTTTGEPTDETTTGGESSTGASDSTTAAESSTGEPAGLADIDMLVVQDVITDSAYTQTVTFAKDSCALEEACVTGSGPRRLLRFDTWTPNVGESDLIVGSPENNPELFEFAPCHNHFHFLDYANYRLLDSKGEVAAIGHKQSFALIDFEPYLPDAGPRQYPLDDGTQGISTGWADIYGAYLDCQWVDITGVEPGEYTLEIHVNPEEHLVEASYDNNIALISVTIGEQDDVGPVLPAPDEWTCPEDFYSSNDGCDCGCGVVDPDCDNPTAAACDYCDANGACSTDCTDITAANNATCD